jgi:electron transfer flavoprotein alpha subunit
VTVHPPRLTPSAVEPFAQDGLDQAELVVVGGRGIENRADLELVEQFARALGGAFGATRPLVMSGLVPTSLLIGQSGRTIAPKLCITVGVSGSTPFLAGVSAATRLLAINWNADASIFAHADYGIVADYRTALPALLEAWKLQ